MAHGTSTGERWRDRRFVSWGLRIVVFVAPIAAAVIAVWIFTRVVDRPASLLPQLVFWLIAIAIAVAAGLLVDRWSRRLLPVAMLFRMSLAFPGEAPNRFALAFGDGPASPDALESTDKLSSDDTAARHLLALVWVLARHDPRTRGHSERVRAYAEMIGTEMGLSQPALDRVRWGALIHDIGKLSVPPEVLGGGDRPTPDEWALIQAHAVGSEPFLYAVTDWLGDGALAAVQHHERWDGRGYPDGLTGEEISLAARIVAVADTYDAMTATRSYREPLRPSMAREQIARQAGAQFDPKVVGAFLDVPVWRLRLVLGPLGWLNEFLWFTRLPHAATGAAATAAVVGVVGLGAAIVFSSPAESSDTADDDIVAPVDTTTTTTTNTTTTAPTTTTTDPPSTTTPTTTSIALTTSTTSSTTSTTTTSTTTVAPAPTTTATPPATTTSAAPPPTTTTTTTTTTTPAPAPPDPIGTGFTLTDPATLPPDLGDGQLTSDTDLFVWSEGIATTATDIELRAFTDGVAVPGDSSTTTTLPAGTQVCTYIAHADPIGAATTFEAELDFGLVPLGFALVTTDLEDTDEFEIDGVDYQPDGLGSTDTVTVDGTVITIELVSSPGTRDQIRIFIPC
ncbi:MAG: HD-GYP domain-containing protein [Actinomycetota bacterium]